MAHLKDLLVAGPSRFIGAVNFNDDVTINGIATVNNSLNTQKLVIKNANDTTIGHTYTGTNYLELVLGNATATSSTDGMAGYLYLYGTGTTWTKFVSGNPSASNTLTLPTASGTLALTSNIPGAEKGITLTGGKYGHSNTAITAGSVGVAQSPSHGGTFTIPQITYDAYGHITKATTVNITLPADNNTDTKVTQAAAITTAGAYPILLGYNTGTAAVTNTVNKAAALTYDPSTKILSVTSLRLTGTGDTNPGTALANSVPLSIGTTSGTHLEIDSNEIGAFSGSTAATLHINYDDTSKGISGGPVLFGSGDVTMKGRLTAKTVRIDNSVYFQYNSTDKCLDVIFE